MVISISRKEKIVSSLAAICFFIVCVAFLIVILVNKNIGNEYVMFYLPLKNHTSSALIVGGENPAILCVFASLFYAVVAICSVKNAWNSRCLFLLLVGDAIFFPLFLCSLLMLHEILQITMFCLLYISLHVVIFENKTAYIAANFIHKSIWGIYFLAVILDFMPTRPGDVVVQCCAAACVSVYDHIRINYGAVDYNFLVSQMIRLLLLFCVFVRDVS